MALAMTAILASQKTNRAVDEGEEVYIYRGQKVIQPEEVVAISRGVTSDQAAGSVSFVQDGDSNQGNFEGETRYCGSV